MNIPNYKVQLVKDGTLSVDDKKLDAPDKIADAVRRFIGPSMKEHVVVVLLNARHRLIGINLVSVGTLTASLIHPREVFQPALLASAAAVVVAHNHPSGDKLPSPEDKEVTVRLAKAGEILGVPLLDHVIVVDEALGSEGDSYWSFREAGGNARDAIEANTHLIAAAPDLLAAAKEALHIQDQGASQTYIDLAIKQLRDAINKAEGKLGA